MRALLILPILLFGCGDSLKAAGEECFGTSECEDGLTCDFGQSPAICSDMQSGRGDAAVTPTIDAADVPVVDANPAAPDARPGTPDAAPVPDAPPPPPDAALPDAAPSDAA